MLNCFTFSEGHHRLAPFESSVRPFASPTTPKLAAPISQTIAVKTRWSTVAMGTMNASNDAHEDGGRCRALAFVHDVAHVRSLFALLPESGGEQSLRAAARSSADRVARRQRCSLAQPASSLPAPNVTTRQQGFPRLLSAPGREGR